MIVPSSPDGHERIETRLDKGAVVPAGPKLFILDLQLLFPGGQFLGLGLELLVSGQQFLGLTNQFLIRCREFLGQRLFLLEKALTFLLGSLTREGLHDDRGHGLQGFLLPGAVTALPVADRDQADGFPVSLQRHPQEGGKWRMTRRETDAICVRARIVGEKALAVGEHSPVDAVDPELSGGSAVTSGIRDLTGLPTGVADGDVVELAVQSELPYKSKRTAGEPFRYFETNSAQLLFVGGRQGRPQDLADALHDEIVRPKLRLGPRALAQVGVGAEPLQHAARRIFQRHDTRQEGTEIAVAPRSGNSMSKGSPVAIDCCQRSSTLGRASGSCTLCQPQPSISARVVPVYSYQRRLYQ